MRRPRPRLGFRKARNPNATRADGRSSAADLCDHPEGIFPQHTLDRLFLPAARQKPARDVRHVANIVEPLQIGSDIETMLLPEADQGVGRLEHGLQYLAGGLKRPRSEERRVGKEWVRQCRFRW